MPTTTDKKKEKKSKTKDKPEKSKTKAKKVDPPQAADTTIAQQNDAAKMINPTPMQAVSQTTLAEYLQKLNTLQFTIKSELLPKKQQVESFVFDYKFNSCNQAHV